MVTIDTSLTAKQTDFVRYYADIASETRNNAYQSAIRAGYSAKTAKSIGQENLTKPDIKQAIAEYSAEIAEKVDVTRTEIIEALRKLAGLDKGAKQLNNGERLRSLELLGKTLVMFADKHILTPDHVPQLDEGTRKVLDEALPDIKLKIARGA